MGQIFCGLDFSLTGAAYSIYDGQLKVNKIKVKRFKKNYYKRNKYIIETLIRELKNVDILFVEDYAYAACGRITDIAEVLGAVKYNLKCKIYEVSPSSLKKALTGKGNSDKQKMIDTVRNKYKIDIPMDDDIADSIGLLFMAKGIIKGKSRIWHNGENNR